MYPPYNTKRPFPVKETIILIFAPVILELAFHLIITTLNPLSLLAYYQVITVMAYLLHAIATFCGLGLLYIWMAWFMGWPIPQLGGKKPPIQLPPPTPNIGGDDITTETTDFYDPVRKPGHDRNTNLPTRMPNGISAQYYGRHGESETCHVDMRRLAQGGILIGSAGDCGMRLPDSSVHGHHAELRSVNGKLCIKALHDMQLNGTSLSPGDMKKVRHGDTLRLGDARVTFN